MTCALVVRGVGAIRGIWQEGDMIKPMIASALTISACLFSAPAIAKWHAANSAVETAAKEPRIAAVLAAADRMDQAILARDAEAFGSFFEAGALVNSPYNTIATREIAVGRIRNGMIDYTSLERTIEHAVTRGDHEVILMGEETYTPIHSSQFAGQTLRRRTTELWSDVNGSPKLVLRQATVVSVATKP
jgi:Domain of unknown function (DUF4440)